MGAPSFDSNVEASSVLDLVNGASLPVVNGHNSPYDNGNSHFFNSHNGKFYIVSEFLLEWMNIEKMILRHGYFSDAHTCTRGFVLEIVRLQIF